jgi:muconate cycloisomerase
MLRIDKIETYLIDLPTIRPHVLSMTTMLEQAVVIVRLFCSDGIQGIGEGTTIGGLSYGPESPENIQLTIEQYIAPVLGASDPSRVAATMAAVSRVVVGNHFAKAAIEMALLDAQGKRVGLPVSELLGGRHREELPVAWTLASGDTARDIDEAERMLALRRHNIFKIKIGKRPLDADVAHVTAVIRAVGDRASIRVDVNQAWDEATAALGISRLESVGVDLIEQPVPAWNRHGMARLAERFITPIMADEMLRGPHDAFTLAASATADVFAVKVAQSGGLYAAAQVAAIAGAAGIGLYGGTMLESSVGTAASAQLFVTFAKLEWETELFGPLLLTHEIVSIPLTYENFLLKLPKLPGLGLELDEERLQFFQRNHGSQRVISLAGAKG